MLNREYQVRANRQGRRKLEGEQLDITFPRRGRPTRFRRLERAGQMRLNLQRPTARSGRTSSCDGSTILASAAQQNMEAAPTDTLEAALQMTFPVRPPTEDELAAEFNRLFPPD